MNNILKRFALILVGVVLALVVVELGARLMIKKENSALSMPMADGTREQLYFDEELGFFPKVGLGGEYNASGCLYNEYDVENRKGRKRVLFIGDSVTHRGKIVEALRELYGDADYEYWNAGVGAFNTAQILEFFRRYNTNIHPDEVVLTFHNNDFQLTPVAKEENGEIVLYIPSREPVQAPAPFIGKTALYRLWLQQGAAEYERRPEDVKKDLAELRRLAEEQEGARFSVVLFPILSPLDEWSEREKNSRENALRIFEELDLRYFDPIEALPSETDQYAQLRQEPDDTWHPSLEGGMLLARFLYDAGLLAPKSPATAEPK